MSDSSPASTRTDPAARGSALRRITVIGAFVNVVLTGAKLVAGVLASSSVMIADAIHSLSDLASDGVALWSMRAAERPPDEDHPYGHGRYETLGTVILAVILLIAATGIAWDAWSRFGETTVPGMLALWAAVVSIVAKEVLYQATLRVGRKHQSPLVIANAWHHRSDAMSSVAALAGIAGARMGFPFLDPVAAVAVAVLIGRVGVTLLRGAAREITDTAIERELVRAMDDGIHGLAGVVSLHELRARRMGPSVLVDVHVEVAGSTTVSDGHQVAERVRTLLLGRHPEVTEVLVHVDPEPDFDQRPGETLARPRDVIEGDVRRVAAGVSGVREITHVIVHFLRGRVVVQVAMRVAPEESVEGAGGIARALRTRLEEGGVADTADIHLELDDSAHESLPEGFLDR